MERICHKKEVGTFFDLYEKVRPACLYRAGIQQSYVNFQIGK